MQHAETIRNLPRSVPALVIIEMTPDDLYELGAAEETDQYWPMLSESVSRIEPPVTGCFTILAKVSDIRDAGCHNSGMYRERVSRKAHEAPHTPLSSRL